MTELTADGIHHKLRAQLAQILYCEPDEVPGNRNFEEVGLDSVLGVELIDAINSEFGLAEKVEAIYEHPTLDRLAAYVAAQAGTKIA